VLYAIDVGPADASIDEVFGRVTDHFDLPEGARAFAKELVCGVIGRRDEIDAVIARHAHRWRVERLAAVDRNAMRIGVYEILHGDLPAAVAIDQAVELARRFGAETSPAFVNGVLDAVAREAGRTSPEPVA
jgi:N utilization substance protein B